MKGKNMRKISLFAVVLLAVGCQQQGGGGGGGGGGGVGANPQTEDQKTLYALGLSIGRSVSVFNLTTEEIEYVKAGITVQVTGKRSGYSTVTRTSKATLKVARCSTPKITGSATAVQNLSKCVNASGVKIDELVASGWVTPEIEYPSYRAFWRDAASGVPSVS